MFIPAATGSALAHNVLGLPNFPAWRGSCLRTRRDGLGSYRGGAPPGDPQPATLVVSRWLKLSLGFFLPLRESPSSGVTKDRPQEPSDILAAPTSTSRTASHDKSTLTLAGVSIPAGASMTP
jgi:hypothetical protein